MALKRKILPESEKSFLNDSDSASDIQQKTEKPPAQQVLPQRKSHLKNLTPRANKIFNTSSSIAVSNEKVSDTILGSTEDLPKSALPSSKSISFGDNFSIPNAVNLAAVPLPDTELFTDDEDEDEIVVQAKVLSEKSLSENEDKKPVSDTVLGFTDDIDNDDEEVIPVLDSEEESEQFINFAPPNQSKNFFNCSKSVSNTSSQINDNFFDNPPSVKDLQLAVRLSDIQRSKMKQQQPIYKPVPVIEEDENVNSESDDQQQEEEASQLEHVEIGPTDEEDNVVDLTIDESPQHVSPVRPQRSSEIVLSANTPRGMSAKISTTTPRSGRTKINIKLNLKISIRDGGADSDTSDSSNNSSPQHLTESQSQVSSHSKSQAGRMEMYAGGRPALKEIEGDEPKTPQKVEPVIDEGLEDMLNEIYGESWKTPQLLKSCKSKRGRENLRKSIYENNFDSFVRNLPSDLESTRLTPSVKEKSTKNDKFKMPTAPLSSTKKTSDKRNMNESPLSTQKSIPKSAKKETPKFLEICDPDTPSTSSNDETDSDDDFNLNDTWNASSDEEYANENERIQKRLTIRQSIVHQQHHEELTFTRDDSHEEQEKLEELLKKYEYKAPPKSETKKITKRKLFSHTISEEHEEDEIVLAEKENEIPKGFKCPTPVKKDLKKPATPTVQKTPTIKSTPKSLAKRFAPLSFLKSLDAEANRSLCDVSALLYRNNYKSKKQDLAIKLFKLYDEKVFDSKLTNVPIKWNKKLLNTAGRCHNSRKNGVMLSSLELSDKVLTSADRLRCTLIHEMCHAASWVLNGENGHGVVWKRWAAKANATFPELPKITVCHDYVIEYKYTYLCIKCKAQSKTHTKSRKVDEIQCSICKGSIKLFENKKNASGEIEMIPVQKKELKGNFVNVNFIFNAN